MGIFLIALFGVLYWYALAPTVLWGDSAKLSIYVKEMYLTFDPVGNHMLHTLFGKFFSLLPIGDFAYRQNLMSACFGIFSLWVFYQVMIALLHDKKSAFLAAVCLGVSHTFWLVSVVNESYSPAMFFLVMSFLFLIRWQASKEDRYLYVLAFWIGISLLNNLLGGIVLPAILFFLGFSKEGRQWLGSWRFPLAIVLFLIGASPLIVIGIIEGALGFGGYTWFLRPQEAFSEVVYYPLYLFYQFPFLGFFLGFFGLFHWFKKRNPFFWFFLVLFVLDILLASGYMRQRRFFLLLPSYVCFSVWIGFGFKELIRKGYLRRVQPTIVMAFFLCGISAGFYNSLPYLSKRLQVDLIRGRQLAFRDNNKFYLNPVKRHEFGPKKYGLQALQAVKPNSLIIGDFTPSMVLVYYQKIEGLRPDVLIDIQIDRYVQTPERRKELYVMISEALKERPVYLADDEESYYAMEELREHFEVIPQEPLWEIRNRET